MKLKELLRILKTLKPEQLEEELQFLTRTVNGLVYKKIHDRLMYIETDKKFALVSKDVDEMIFMHKTKEYIEALKIIKNLTKGQVVYNDFLVRELLIKDSLVDKIMSTLIKNGVLKEIKKVICPECGFSVRVNSIKKIKEQEFCPECGNKLVNLSEPLKNVHTYKVVK